MRDLPPPTEPPLAAPRRIALLSLGTSQRNQTFETIVLGQRFVLERIGTDGDRNRLLSLIQELDGQVAAIGLEDIDAFYLAGNRVYTHRDAIRFVEAARKTPVVDGFGLKHTLERWAVTFVHNSAPDLLDGKRAFVLNGVDRYGIAQVLQEFTRQVVYGDLLFTTKLDLPLRSLKALETYTRLMFPLVCNLPLDLLHPTGSRSATRRPRHARWFSWADIIVGDFSQIRRYAPSDLSGKTILTNTLSVEEEADLKARGAMMVVTTTPDMGGYSLGTHALEAIFVALLQDQGYIWDPRKAARRDFRDEYLNLILESGIEPRMLELNPPKTKKKPTFVFVIHPLRVSDAFQVKAFAWLRNLPPNLLEMLLANVPPMFISKAKGIVDADGNEIDGYFYALVMTPKMMLAADPEEVYKGLVRIAEMAQHRGAKVMGLGAFTSVVGDAGVSVAKRSPIPVTSGNSLTIWACVESARQATQKMGKPLSSCRAMVVGATGSIGKAVTKVLAEEVAELYVVSKRPEKVLDFVKQLQQQGVKAEGGTSVDPFIGRCDLIVATTTDPDGVIDVMKLKPGCVVVDVARPPDVSPEEAGKRNDILVIESGEIRCPGNPDWGVNLGLPRGIAFACLTETMVLTFEKRWESYTVGRDIDVAKVQEIGELAQRRGFVLSGIYSFGEPVSDEEIQLIRTRAEANLHRASAAPAPTTNAV